MESDFTNRRETQKQNEKVEYRKEKTKGRVEYDKYDVEEVAEHSTVDDCWVINQKNVYNVTHFLNTHPGGADLILNSAGSDITDKLTDEDLHNHTIHAYNLLREYKIGELRSNDDSESSEPDSDIANNNLLGWKEDTVDWNKGLVFQVYKFGADYLKWVHSPVNKKLILFDSPFIEFFSKTQWYAIPLVWIPVFILCAVFSHDDLLRTVNNYRGVTDRGDTFLATVLFFILMSIGVPTWTLLEYLLHRYIFHLEPKGDSPFFITMHFFFHGQHHKVPFDEQRLVFPPAAAAGFVFAFWRTFATILPGGIGTSLFCGGLLGYVAYDLIHYYMHHGSPVRGTYLHEMKRYHVLHHFEDPSSGYGISTKFWDYPFNTINKKFL